MKMIFMGTPDFAKVILQTLYESKHEVIAVLTQPDKPKGRGYAVQSSPVKTYAEQNGLKVYQPNSLRDSEFEELLKELMPDVIIVAAYGKILPVNVLEFPRYGCINVHGSILPKYRGAAPIQRAIMNGETVTGVTIIQMNDGIDTGDMFLKEEISISTDDNFETVHDKLAAAGSKALLETLSLIETGGIIPIKQNDSEATYAPKIEKSECAVKFSADAVSVHNMIRGLSPFPLAYGVLNGKKIKFISSSHNEKSYNVPNGTVVALDNGFITVSCGSGSIDLDSVLPEGKNRMTAVDFINGRKINIGDIFAEVE